MNGHIVGNYGRTMSSDKARKKNHGQYFTPEIIAKSLVGWVIRKRSDRLLDPSCGDGRFLAQHRRSVGVERDQRACFEAQSRAPWSLIHEGDFFRWASETRERFECAAGNPPFIRYQKFSGVVRKRSLGLCRALGANFSALTSSWAPFLVVTASLLKKGGRMAFVVPAEVGHAPYSEPLLTYLAENFADVRLIAVQNKFFPDLSEDAWLLYASGFQDRTDHFGLTPLERFDFTPAPPSASVKISLNEWRRWNSRIRPFLLSADVRELYDSLSGGTKTIRLGEVARVGIGYVTGSNDFFHLRPSQADSLGIQEDYLHPAVRKGRSLTRHAVTRSTVRSWIRNDEPILLLRLTRNSRLSREVQRYLDSSGGVEARQAYKCRNRTPWYAVPDVYSPHAFLSYMSGQRPMLVANHAKCVCTNSVHAVTLKGRMRISRLQKAWESPFVSMSCEIEGHPLGGGMLKLEPGEAARVLLPKVSLRSEAQIQLVKEGIETMRRWRHCV